MRTKLLTKQELRELEAFRQGIIDRALSTKPIDREQAERAYNELLVVMGHKPVSNFQWFDSPFAMHKTVGDQLGDQLEDQLRGQLGGQLGDQLWDQLEDQLGDQLWDQLEDQLRGQLGDQLEDQLGDQLEDQLRGQLGDQLWDQLGDQLRGQLWDQLWDQLRGQLDQWHLQYLMWIDYAAELDGITADKDQLNKLKRLSRLGANAFWIIPLKDGAAFCERPVRLVMRNGRLDYDHDAAIEFKDGWKLYYLNGVHLEEDLWQKIVDEKITLKNLAEITNPEQRAVAIQYMRADRMLKQVNAKLIDTGKRGVELYEVLNFMGTGDTEYCMKLEHPSIPGKYYIEWVEPKVGKGKDADICMAVSRQISVKDYLTAEVA